MSCFDGFDVEGEAKQMKKLVANWQGLCWEKRWGHTVAHMGFLYWDCGRR